MKYDIDTKKDRLPEPSVEMKSTLGGEQSKCCYFKDNRTALRYLIFSDAATLTNPLGQEINIYNFQDYE